MISITYCTVTYTNYASTSWLSMGFHCKTTQKCCKYHCNFQKRCSDHFCEDWILLLLLITINCKITFIHCNYSSNFRQSPSISCGCCVSVAHSLWGLCVEYMGNLHRLDLLEALNVSSLRDAGEDLAQWTTNQLHSHILRLKEKKKRT